MRVSPIARAAVLVMAAGLVACDAEGPANEPHPDAATDVTAVMLRTEACDCCGAHGAYLEEAGYEVEEEIVDDPNAEAGVPAGLGSCHVTMIDSAAVVGHVPADVIAEFRAASLSADGLSLPGMPSGSPGMPGGKDETWEFVTFTDGAPGPVFATR